MKKYLKIIWLTWISLLVCMALFFGLMIVVQYHNLSLYKKPYLKVPIAPPYPREEIIPFEVKVLTEVRTMKVFLIPAPNDALVDCLELTLVSPSGMDWKLLLFRAQCEWQGKNFPAEYVSGLKKCRYRLKLKIKEPPPDLQSGTTLILAPCSEFGGVILFFYMAGFLITLFVLLVSYLISTAAKSPVIPASVSQDKHLSPEEPRSRKE